MRALLIAVAVILWPILALGEITGPARVIDGDTIEVAGERIRLHGIDAPEMDPLFTLSHKPRSPKLIILNHRSHLI